MGWALISELLEDLAEALGSAGAGAALGGLFGGLGSALTGALSNIGTVLTRVVGVVRRIATVISNALRRIVNFFERIVRSRFWQHVASLVKTLSNPRTAITVITGTALTLIGLAELGSFLRAHKEEIETQLEELHRNVIQTLNNLKLQYEADVYSYWYNVYNTIMSALPSFWGLELGMITATLSCLSNINIAWKFIIVTLLDIFIPILDIFLGVLARVVPYLIDVFGYIAELSCKYGLWLIFFILIPMAMGLAVVRMYTVGLSTFPYSIGQPVEVSDRGFGWVMFNVLYPMALLHPAVKQVLEQAKQYYKRPIVPPTVPPPPKPTVTSLVLQLPIHESLTVQLYKGRMEYMYIHVPEHETIHASLRSLGIHALYIKVPLHETITVSLKSAKVTEVVFGWYSKEKIKIDISPISLFKYATAFAGPWSIGSEWVPLKQAVTGFAGPWKVKAVKPSS